MSFSVNRVFLLGNLGGDPEMRFGTNGQAKTTFSIATSYSVKEGEQWVEKTEWHRVVQWGKKAENTAEWHRKGSKVFVEGRLQTRSYEEDGVKKYITEVVAQEVIGMANRASSGNEGEFRVPAGSASAPPSGRSNQYDDLDDLPF